MTATIVFLARPGRSQSLAELNSPETSYAGSTLENRSQQENTTSGTGTLRMHFTNTKTGEAVIPQAVLLDRVSIMTATLPGGVVSLEAPNGQHSLNIEAEGFLPFEGKVRVDGSNTLVQGFELEPDPALTRDEKETSVPEDMAEVTGTITDGNAGSPLQGVRVSVTDPSGVAETDARGRYGLQVRTGKPRDPSKDQDGGLIPVTVEFSKSAYRSQRHDRVMLSGGDRIQLNVRMDRLTSDTADAALPEVVTHMRGGEQRRVSQWIFDVSGD